jgi:PadR family transcriptional regulator PadR
MTDRLDTLRMELRRGVLVLAVLAALRDEEHGYALRKRLADNAIDVEEGTLYPLIRRLERHGLLESRWSDTGGRKRRFYTISSDGRSRLAELRREWSTLSRSLGKLLEEGS